VRAVSLRDPDQGLSPWPQPAGRARKESCAQSGVLGGVEGRSLRSRRGAAGFARPWHHLRASLRAGYRVAGATRPRPPKH